MKTDARTLTDGTVLTTEVLVIGGGPAGISLSLNLAAHGRQVLLLESTESDDPAAQDLNRGTISGQPIVDGFGGTHTLDTARRRVLGGATRLSPQWPIPQWAGFNSRPTYNWDGLTPDSIITHYEKAHDLIGLGPVNFDPAYWEGVTGKTLPSPVLDEWKILQNNAKDFSDYVPQLIASSLITLLVNGNAVRLMADPVGETQTSGSDGGWGLPFQALVW